MDETKLNRLRKELADNYREFEKEMAKLEKDSKVEDGVFFTHEKKRNQAKAKMAQLKEVMEATEDLQKKISSSSTATPADQEKAHKKLVELKDKYNFKKSNCSYDINRPLYNTLITHHNRSIKKNVEKPVRTFLKKTAIALIPLAAIPLLPAIGLGAIGGVLATPLAWVGAGLLFRSGYHLVQGIQRRGTLNGLGAKSADEISAKYDELYPTQSEVKGFFRTLSYNREIKNTAGKLYSSLETVDGYKDFKGTEFAHSGEKTDEEEKGKEGEKGKEKEKEKEKGKGKEDDKTKERKDIVNKFIEKVKNTEIKSIDDVNELVKEETAVIPYADESNSELLNVVSAYLKLARKVLGKTSDEEYAAMLEAFVKEDAYKTPEAKALQNLLVGKLVELAKSIGAYDEFIKPFYEKEPGEKGPGEKGPEKGPGEKGPEKGSGEKGPGEKGSGEKGPGSSGDDRTVEESYAKTPEMLSLLNGLRSFDTSSMTIENYNKANRLIAKIDQALRAHPEDFGLDNDDEMNLAEIRSMADAYESKTALVDKLKVCEAAMGADAFYKDAFEDCIKEFYNIVGHTNYVSEDNARTAVRGATRRNLLSRAEYERVKNVLSYYKKYSSLTSKSTYAKGQVDREEFMRDMEEAFGGKKR